MRLPRRVPWASLAELDRVCNWIFADETDLDAKIKAINRLSAWRAITPLPHALEAVLSILSSIILDESVPSSLFYAQRPHNGQIVSPEAKISLILSVRQSYATAIVRLVNGLVDPLQLGAYARSIASIAAQIGLPQWLVEIRHAATHEDLPGLEILRSGARESLAWLLHNYFIPTLSACDTSQSTAIVNLSPLAPFIKQYKSLMKTISRDTSLTPQYKEDLAKVLHDIERWISEVKVASSAVIFHGWGADQTGDGEDEKERWALERLCDALIERGGLVPVSGKKRLASNLKSPPILTQSIIAVWTPLLSTLKTSHPSFPSTLVSAITDFLICRPAAANSDDFSRKDLSYELCLAAWAAWCVEQWETDSSDVQVENYLALRRKDVVLGLISALTIRVDERMELRKGANALLGLLVREDPELKEISTSLLAAAQRSVSFGPNDTWMDMELQVMEERLETLISSLDAENAEQAPVMMDIDKETSSGSRPSRKVETDAMPKGWTKVPAESWRSCPIGVFVI